MSDKFSDAKKEQENQWALQTRMVQGGILRSPFGETSEGLYLTSGYVYDNAEQAEARFKEEDKGFTYSRYENPTVEMFQQRMNLLEGAVDSRATSSGMAAVHAALLSLLSAGDHIVASKALFGSNLFIIQTLCSRFGIDHTLVDGADLNQWEAAVRPNTKVFFFETPSNPNLTLVDIAGVVAIAQKAGVKTIVDNVFATPILQRPLELGVDIVVYSGTKHIDGQGRCLGGIVLSSDAKYIKDTLQPFVRNTGPTMSPFNAWVMLKSLETLELRVTRHTDNAEKVAAFLGAHPKIAKVLYPHHESHPQLELARRQMTRGGNMVSFQIDGDKASAFRVANALQIIRISNNLGDAKSLITHPSTTTHFRLTEEARQELGITPANLRLSVGLEDADDLCRDLDEALAKA
ncbi:MAG: O-succinylhomoserine sulfhydrylase [Alphaproteobacteria bacterium]|nr:MAG: O-succinylhomoserine sulfhydrylase [Alphaproteobacteria bacterium]